MWTCFVFSIGLSVALASELELFGNGWVPVSSDIVYNQIRRGITQAPRFTKTVDVYAPNPDVLNFVSKHQEHEDGSKNYNLEDDSDELNNEDSTTYVDETYDNEPRLQHENPLSQKLLSLENRNGKTVAIIRKPKKLVNIDTQVILNRKFLPEIDKPDNTNLLKRNDNLKFKKQVTEDNVYEVTESINIDHEKQEESAVNENGYEYNRPAQNNFSTELIKHLSKYNINENDNLQNYALSRRLKTETPVKQTRDHLNKSLRFRAPIRYNSLNHLSVDPLLSVFLSNYGHYLQGQYGISNNYNNLYGYLASNNIHNNKPFGLYKIFSDTDSSNK